MVRKQLAHVIFIIFFFFILDIQSVYSRELSISEIEQDVDRVIKNYFVMVNPFKITVNEAGNVTIEGKVGTLFDKNRITEVVSTVPGVLAIHNVLVVNMPILNDRKLEEKLQNGIMSIVTLGDPEKVKITVDSGIITLTGQVQYYREKLIVQQYLSYQNGVIDIVNNLAVAPLEKPISDSDIKMAVDDILDNQFFGDDKIVFTVKKGVVNLNGETLTLRRKNRIEEEIFRVIGIRQVINNIKIALH